MEGIWYDEGGRDTEDTDPDAKTVEGAAEDVDHSLACPLRVLTKPPPCFEDPCARLERPTLLELTLHPLAQPSLELVTPRG